MQAKVIIEYPVKSLDKTFTYNVPSEIMDKICIGMKVLVPFGSNILNGFILDINHINISDKLKYIIQIENENFILSKEMLLLGEYMQEKTLATKISCYQVMLPKGYKAKSNNSNYDKYETFLTIKDQEDIKEYILNNKLSNKRKEILNTILIKGSINKKEITTSIYKSLLNTNLFLEEKVQKYRINQDGIEKKINKLTLEQEEIYNQISLDQKETYLLYGVTGSGKTEIYLKLIEDVIKSGKTAILLSPEISLTMQLVKRFYSRFQNKVAVLHSNLSAGERYDEYTKILNNEVNIVVGTRSAIFAPLKNIGIIIIDEEHSESYKQDNNPRYHARDIALYRSNYHNCPLVLGSATPLLETMTRAVKGIYKLLVLKNRVNKRELPTVKLIDMNIESKKRNFILSEDLIDSIKDRIKKNEQTILLLNRRGFSTFINCSCCGYTYTCPNCDISLTYHKSTNNLMCHYCGYHIKKNDLCPKCNEDSLNYLGMGTEQIEEWITGNIENAKVIRMDQDTTTRKGSHEKIIDSFKNNEYNILLGTQMISKGLDFENVTLVGVINSDLALNIPDFRSNENTFSLLNQVSGRSGRGEKKGEVILQTFNTDNSILKYAKDNDYKSFYVEEMNFRRTLKYPPYFNIVSLKIVSIDYNLALSESKKVVKELKQKLSNECIILGPTTAAILKYKNKYRFQIVIKYKLDKNIYQTIKKIDEQFILNKKVDLEIDFNPTRI